MKELLEKLKSLDPTTYAAFEDTELGKYDCYDDYCKTTEYIYQDRLINKAQMAWLQACLQEAISSKCWHWLLEDSDPSIRTGISGFVCDICDKNYDVLAGYVQGDTPVKALLSAYIAACEANR